MAENPAQDKTEQATPRKREQAIEEGQVPKSNELNSAIVLLSILIAFGVMSTNFTNTINYFVIYTYQKSSFIDISIQSFPGQVAFAAKILFLILAPVLTTISLMDFVAKNKYSS